MFLSADEGEWALEIAKWQAETSAANRPMTGAVQWFKSLQHSAQTLVSGRGDEIQEDAEYIKIRDFVNGLEGFLAEAHRQAGRLVKKEVDLGAALAEFAAAAEVLGKHDDGAMRAAFGHMYTRANEVSALSRTRAEAMANEFQAPLKEACRTVKAAQAAMAGRAQSLTAYSQVCERVRVAAEARCTTDATRERVAQEAGCGCGGVVVVVGLWCQGAALSAPG